ncbi:MAG: ATP-binding protein [Candidatus Cyclobacteriaceae bacterium M2_1C_046]
MRAGIKSKVLAGFILGLLAIGLIGYQVHNQMTSLASSMYNNQPQNNLVRYQKILSTLSDAESSVRTFYITNNSNDIRTFNTSKEKLKKFISEADEQTQNDELVKLNNLIYSKIYTMEEIIKTRRKNPTENVLEEALDKIDEITDHTAPDFKENTSPSESLEHPDKKTDLIAEKKTLEKDNSEESDIQNENKKKEEEVEEVEEEEKSFFERLFSRRQPEKETKDQQHKTRETEVTNNNPSPKMLPDSSDQLAKNKNNKEKSNSNQKALNTEEKAAQIEDSLERLSTKKKLQSTIWKDKMLTLIEEDNLIMQRIRNEMAKLEQKERRSQNKFISAASRSKDIIVNNTTAVGIGAFTLILILSLVVVQDFEKLKKNRLSLISEKEKADRHARVKEDFLANMSHEIRTPMNAIVGYTELLEKTSLASDQKAYLNTIQKSSRHLMVILNDILDYSKLESGKLIINKEPFNPLKSVNQVVKSMEADALKKGLQLKTNISPEVKTNLLGDAVRFQQILFNLVSNAIKFTDKGVVTIELSATDADYEQLIELKVKDTGTGIRRSSLNKIFRNFEQAESGRNRKYGGTGLGLAIVKRLVKLHHGTIEVESEEGKGSEFTVSIPYEVSKIQKKNPKVKKKKTENYNFSNYTILAVDDQEYNLELVKIILEKWGANIKIVTSAKEALQQLRDDHAYNLVLMDVQMPEMTGTEATEIIRKKYNKAELPVIALTAASTKEETDKCLTAGMNDVLLKPFKQKELKEILKKYGPDHQTENKNSNIYSLENLEKLSNGDDAFIADMLEVFVKNTISDFDELQKHVASENWNAVHRTAHKMIAPCRHLGIKQLVNVLEKIEVKSVEEDNINTIKALTEETDILIRNAVKQIKNEINKLNQLQF